MRKQQKALEILRRLSLVIAKPETELAYSTPFELLVAVVLSAQCTDKRVNMATPALFVRYPTPAEMALATPEEIFPYIKSISFPNNKAKHLAGLSRKLVEQHNGLVPADTAELQKLPGVGRKSANVVGAVVFRQAVIPVDTHVFRVANRLGLASGKTPREVEEALMLVVPPELRHNQHHLFILHGRRTCHARKPDCTACILADLCPFFAKLESSLANNPESKALPPEPKLRKAKPRKPKAEPEVKSLV